VTGSGASHPTLVGHLQICRFDHWTKNVFALPGLVVALSIEPTRLGPTLLWRTLLGLLALGLVASSNYVLNELLDAGSDVHHPTKAGRPVPSGRVHVPLAWAQWLLLALLGGALGLCVSTEFALLMGVFWLMGCAYNVRPLRLKDRPYVDVLAEGANNPVRMLAGWWIVGPDAFAPGSLLASYWMIGCYFMAMKRYAEYRHLGDAARAAAYRRSFAHYDEAGLLIAVMFYAATSMLLLGAFIVRYRLSLILSFPFVALVMALYLRLGLREPFPVQRPETLYRQRSLVVAIAICGLVVTLCLFVDMPWLARLFAPTAPTDPAYR
jgi:decaprenyl-phosphate phosphoribosyltransferase